MLLRIFQKDDVVLFQGDSITDAGRSREDKLPNSWPGLGYGYAATTAAALLAQYPQLNLQCYNRGVGGDVVGQLDARWQEDCLDLKPNVLSILIGINDTARELAGDNPHADNPQGYERTYRKILDAARKQNPDLRIVICEPFAMIVGHVTEAWMLGLTARRTLAKQIAADYDAIWVGFLLMFDRSINEAPKDYWMADGVHPSPAGHHRMAQAWLDAVNGA